MHIQKHFSNVEWHKLLKILLKANWGLWLLEWVYSFMFLRHFNFTVSESLWKGMVTILNLKLWVLGDYFLCRYFINQSIDCKIVCAKPVCNYAVYSLYILKSFYYWVLVILTLSHSALLRFTPHLPFSPNFVPFCVWMIVSHCSHPPASGSKRFSAPSLAIIPKPLRKGGYGIDIPTRAV